jgi:hypothetical protein
MSIAIGSSARCQFATFMSGATAFDRAASMRPDYTSRIGQPAPEEPFQSRGPPDAGDTFVGICCATTGPALAVIDEAGRHYRYGAAVTLLGSSGRQPHSMRSSAPARIPADFRPRSPACAQIDAGSNCFGCCAVSRRPAPLKGLTAKPVFGRRAVHQKQRSADIGARRP